MHHTFLNFKLFRIKLHLQIQKIPMKSRQKEAVRNIHPKDHQVVLVYKVLVVSFNKVYYFNFKDTNLKSKSYIYFTGSTSCGRSSTVSTSSVNDGNAIQSDSLDDGKVMR